MEPTEERRVLRLPVAEIRPNPRQPRRFFDERGLRGWLHPSAATALSSP